MVYINAIDEPEDVKSQRIMFQEDIKQETQLVCTSRPKGTQKFQTDEMKEMSKALMPKKHRRLLSKIDVGSQHYSYVIARSSRNAARPRPLINSKRRKNQSKKKPNKSYVAF